MLIIHRVPIVLQEYPTDCGISCFLAILRYYGANAPREWLREHSNTSKTGVSMYGLKQVAVFLGFQVEGKKGPFDSLPSSDYPVIAHLNIHSQEHFVVVESVNSHSVFLMDPAIGHCKISRKEFLKRVTGNYLCFYKKGYLKTIEIKQVCRSVLFTFLKNEIFFLLFFLFLGLLSFLLELATLFQLKLLIEYGIMSDSDYNLCLLGVFFFFLNLLKIFISFLFHSYGLKLEERFFSFFRKKFCYTLLTLPYLYYKTRSSGAILSYFEEMTFFCSFPIQCLKTFISNFPLFLFFCFYFSFLSPFFLCFLCCAFFLLFLFLLLERKFYFRFLKQNYFWKEQEKSLEYHMISGIEMIKGLHLEKQYFRFFKKGGEELIESDYILQFQQLRQQEGYQLLEMILYFSFLIFGGIQVIQQKYDFTIFLLLEGFLKSSFRTGSSFLGLWFSFSYYKKIRERFDEIFSLKHEFFLSHSSLTISFLPMIQFHHLFYAYGEKMILKDINFKIPSGSKVFLYGDSGSGKSTLAKILAGFYSIPFGMITIGSVDLTHFNLEYLREEITYCGQNDMLLPGSIYDNITLGRKVSWPALQDILKLTGFDQVLKKKKIQLEDDILSLGEDFSAGEKSRLFLARIFLKKSKIYIFDECFQHLDVESERKIVQAIFQKYKTQTIFYISHRLSCRDLFSVIFRLRDGCCYEEIL